MIRGEVGLAPVGLHQERLLRLLTVVRFDSSYQVISRLCFPWGVNGDVGESTGSIGNCEGLPLLVKVDVHGCVLSPSGTGDEDSGGWGALDFRKGDRSSGARNC